MASRRIHLYANGNNTSDDNFNFDGNITLDCISNCVGICVYGVCFPSPPSSPASLPNDNSTYVTLPINVHRSDRLTPTLIITAVSAVAGCFALLLALYACFRLRRRRRRPPAREDAADALNRDEVDSDFVPGGEIEHHIWYIRTQGLDDSTIASITSWIYRSSDGLIDGRDCSVCLGEFYEGDLVRLLPKCSHAFHLSCIDRWLRSHINCPLCRAPIVPPGAAAAAPAPSPASPATAFITDLVEPIIGSPVPVESTQVEAFPSASIGDEIEIGIMIDRSQEETSSRSPVLLELLPNSSEDEDNLQPIRRSVSMDALGVLGRAEEEEMPSANGDKPRGFYLKRNLRRKFHSKIGRPLSSQSARWFYPRYARPQNTILPL